MKYTLCVTQECNLSCHYCYIRKKKSVMSIDTAKRIIDFIYNNTPPDEKIEIGFFGGEPLLEFELVTKISDMIENHISFDIDKVQLSLVTNGTIFSDKIANVLKEHNIAFCLSCDGPPHVQDVNRRFPDGRGSSEVVENTINEAKLSLPWILVNAVYGPQTFYHLPEVIDYFSSLKLRQIYLNPDYSARWSKREAELISGIYRTIGEKYIDFHFRDNPYFISLIDSKIAVILRGGYKPQERCRMGTGEFGFAPSGNIYPCERLIGMDDGESHCIGHINAFLGSGKQTELIPGININIECAECGLKSYCMNWCGCSNYFSSGYYNKVGAFLCASEKAAILTAFDVFKTLENKLGPTFMEHLSGFSTTFIYDRSQK